MSLLVPSESFMSDKNQKNTKKIQAQESHIFEIHTMESDNLARKNPITKNIKEVPSAKLPVQTATEAPFAAKKMQKPPAMGSVQKTVQPDKKVDNPFLTDKKVVKKESQTASFAPGKKKDPVEKINNTPADIAPKKDLDKAPQKKPKKIMQVVMIVFIMVFLIGAVGFGIFMLKFNNAPKNVQDDTIIENEFVDDGLIEDAINDDVIEIEIPDVIEETKPMYSTDITNYISIDVESQSSEIDIVKELKSIVTNMKKDDLDGPVSFIVTDKNSNPISFHIFAMSANMDIPQDLLISLEEDFEIYAYNDGVSGIRFGLIVDIKNVDTLQTSLTTNEAVLPAAFDILVDGFGKTATDVTFSDGVYETHPIRYYNLDTVDMYSIDYTINDRRFVIGTTKDTIRAIIDYQKSAQMPKNNDLEAQY